MRSSKISSKVLSNNSKKNKKTFIVRPARWFFCCLLALIVSMPMVSLNAFASDDSSSGNLSVLNPLEDNLGTEPDDEAVDDDKPAGDDSASAADENGEEGSLEDHVDATAQSDLPGQANTVHRVHLDVVLGDVALHCAGQAQGQLLRVPGAVEQEGATRFDVLHHAVFIHVTGIVAGHEIGFGYEIGGFNGFIAKPEMGNCHAS